MIKAREWAHQCGLAANGEGGRIPFLLPIKEMPRKSYVSLYTVGDVRVLQWA